jgi:hypothetical protein
MAPSVGVMDPSWVKALVIDDGEGAQICFVTIDGIGSDDHLNFLAYGIAYQQGFTIPYSNVIFSGSHSHSGPGAISSDFLWEFAPATDLIVPELQKQLATSMATAMVNAFHNMTDAKFAIATGNLTGVTQNRRARISPILKPDSIDPNLGLIRVDALDGTPIATLWNYAIHGVCYGPENMKFSGDIMGKSCQFVEEAIGGVVLFANSDAGDIDPGPGMCNGQPDFQGASLIAKAVVNLRASLPTSTTVKITPVSKVVDFGPTNLNYTLARFNNCSHGGFLDICTLCAVLRCDLNAHLDSAWIENQPRFTAIRFDTANNRNTVIVTAPGEPLLELGWWIRNDTMSLGFDTTLLFGYSNAHMGYFATPIEYDIGGYESQLTLWGINTANMIRDAIKATASLVKK